MEKKKDRAPAHVRVRAPHRCCPILCRSRWGVRGSSPSLGPTCKHCSAAAGGSASRPEGASAVVPTGWEGGSTVGELVVSMGGATAQRAGEEFESCRSSAASSRETMSAIARSGAKGSERGDDRALKHKRMICSEGKSRAVGTCGNGRHVMWVANPDRASASVAWSFGSKSSLRLARVSYSSFPSWKCETMSWATRPRCHVGNSGTRKSSMSRRAVTSTVPAGRPAEPK
mmetsp:Transcript_18478/g.46981  ORF Transcript_18478/g.46981 Transcript_18478/m.46981 type:complete len:229 (-) Transcript_18478:1163-1849(-)